MRLYNYAHEDCEKTNKLIFPIHINHLHKIPFNEFIPFQDLIDGYLIICDDYKDFNFLKIDEMKNHMEKLLSENKPRYKFGSGHPSKF